MDDATMGGIFDDFGRRYPPLITVAQAAEIALRPIGTIYDWSSRGLFDGFKAPGRRILLGRDAFIRFLTDRKDL